MTSNFTQPMETSSEPVSSVLRRVMKEVFDFNQYQELAKASIVCRSWKKIIEITPPLELESKGGFFGKVDWERYFGEVGVEPPLPPDIYEVLNSPCPFWRGRKVQDTHLLVLIPETVNGEPLTLNSLKELIQRPEEGGHATKYLLYMDCVKNKLGDAPAPASHWALMTKDVIPVSRDKRYTEQCALIERRVSETNFLYVYPNGIDTIVCILMHHAKTGERLYPKNPLTYTRCREKVTRYGWHLAVGGFSHEGFIVSNDIDFDYAHGVGCLMKF